MRRGTGDVCVCVEGSREKRGCYVMMRGKILYVFVCDDVKKDVIVMRDQRGVREMEGV